MSANHIIHIIAKQLGLPQKAVDSTVLLLNEGSTVPFIARYRKEATGSLNEVEILNIQKTLESLNDLVKRKAFVLDTIKEQGKLTEKLQQKIVDCWDPILLEDIYLPYKKKRKTRATVAKEQGLEPLADLILDQRTKHLNAEAKRYLTKQVNSIDLAFAGARDIIAERINETANSRNVIRKLFERSAMIKSKVVKKKKAEAEKYQDYFEFEELASKAPAHRILAVFRGEKEGFLKAGIEVDETRALDKLQAMIIHRQCPYECEDQLILAIKDAFKRLLSPGIETEFRKKYKEKADLEAIEVFSENLKQLLLAPPVGNKRVMGIDPGFRSGCKVVCLDEHGSLIEYNTIFPHPPQNQLNTAKSLISKLIQNHQIQAISIGNGTAGKETFSFIKSLNLPSEINSFLVNENGASIYSASEIARKEFPDLDLTVRGAISIARRLMDPLSELVKIDPKSIGVGQYQHDVNQTKLKNHLTSSVEHCVNAVGIDLNTASEHVLTYVSGLGPTLAKNIVLHRNENQAFQKISDLKKVPRMGAKAFQQCAGFLRIRNGKNVLDNTGVHPERYALVKNIAKDQNISLTQLISNRSAIENIDKQKYVNQEIGLPTLSDIFGELSKPGHDIRGLAKVFEFTPGLTSINDLYPDMMVKGIINNITKFGAFVDIGIKEAGLIHISQLSDQYVSDPLKIVKLNQEVFARVIEVDVSRKRISLSLKTPKKQS